MEKITIAIETRNAAFEDNGSVHELSHILLTLSYDLVQGKRPEKLLDSNGNKVGTVIYE